jgi:hypothetical protein
MTDEGGSILQSTTLAQCAKPYRWATKIALPYLLRAQAVMTSAGLTIAYQSIKNGIPAF